MQFSYIYWFTDTNECGNNFKTPLAYPQFSPFLSYCNITLSNECHFTPFLCQISWLHKLFPSICIFCPRIDHDILFITFSFRVVMGIRAWPPTPTHAPMIYHFLPCPRPTRKAGTASDSLRWRGRFSELCIRAFPGGLIALLCP